MHLQICVRIQSLTIENFVQVSSATATFAMTFSSSMSVVEYYFLRRFLVPYGMESRHMHMHTRTY